MITSVYAHGCSLSLKLFVWVGPSSDCYFGFLGVVRSCNKFAQVMICCLMIGMSPFFSFSRAISIATATAAIASTVVVGG